jgi:hypothetical protein
MSVTLNSAGSSAADAIVQGATFEYIIAASTMDVATFDAAWLDTAAGLPGTNGLSGASPAMTVTTRGTNGGYTHSNRRLVIGATAGITAGDAIYVNHASITPNVARIESIFDSSTIVISASDPTLPNPFTADAAAVSFQVAWRFALTAGTAPSVTSAGGQQNYFKARLSDSSANQGSLSESHFIKNLPAGALLAALAGIAFNAGGTTNDNTPTLSVLSGFGTNNGGISHIGLENHGTQGVNNATWWDLTSSDKTFAAAITNGLQFSAGDGIKYGRLRLKTKNGSSSGIAIDWAITLDAVAPTILFFVVGR